MALVGALEGGRERALERIGRFRASGVGTVGLSEADEIRVDEVGCDVSAAVVKILLQPDVAVLTVVEDHGDHAETLLDGRRELADLEQHSAVPFNRHNGEIRSRRFRPKRGAKSPAERVLIPR